MKNKGNLWGLLPIVVFLCLYLGSGIYFEYLSPQEGRMGFYVMSVVLAFFVALVVAFRQNRKVSFDKKMRICAMGMGDENIATMIFIFLLAGAFSGLAKAAGGATSTANLLLNIIPADMAIPGVFLIACLISMSMGTSVGTISVLTPIAVAISTELGNSLPFTVATVVGGAMFGDNLSFISDTTIAATKTQNVEMKDKFRENFRIALPAAVLTLILLVFMSRGGADLELAAFKYNTWQAMPYFIVLIASLIGIKVFTVLGFGIILFIIVGLMTGSVDVPTIFFSMGGGMNGMFETIVVTILVASMGALMKANGGFLYILEFIKHKFHGKIGGMFGISFLTAIMDIATANNTVAIVMAGPIAKDISKEFGISGKKTASLMDTISCVCQGSIPYGAQLLIAAGIAGISSLEIIPNLFYPFFLLISVIIFIFIDAGRKEV